MAEQIRRGHDMLEVSDHSSARLGMLQGCAQIADYIGIGMRTTYRLLEARALPAKKVNGRWYASRNDLHVFFTTVSS